MFKTLVRVGATAAVLGACSALSKSSPITRDEAIAIARNHVRRPDMEKSAVTFKTREAEKIWVVELVQDPRALGGDATVVIDKRNKEVLAAFSGQ